MTADKVRDTGITVLAKGGHQPVADIVFIHGVQGHPERTWTYDKSGRSTSLGFLKRPSRKADQAAVILDVQNDDPKNPESVDGAKANPSPSILPTDTEASVFWPKDLLPNDCSDARILTYGYDSHISGFFKAAANQDGIYQHGRKLLHALKEERRQAPRRPLIIIAHSLGGIIVKEMLLQANDKAIPSSREIYISLYAIVFFGTPHRGSGLASYGQTVERLVSMLGFSTNKSLLHDLKPNGQMLEKIRMDFLKLVNDRDNQIQFFSFQENRGLTKTSIFPRKVVENVSSSLDHHSEQINTIDADHKMMCRFHGPSDEGYKQVSGVVKAYMEEMRRVICEPKHELTNIQIRAIAECAESLRYPGMFERQNELMEADDHTFEWIFDDSQTGFSSWRHNDDGLFWINGKPGSGKSTLMKFLYNRMKIKISIKPLKDIDLAVAGFFFSNRGLSRREDSFRNFLRSILYQILSQIQGLFVSIEDLTRTAQDVKGSYRWTESLLIAAFRQIKDQTLINGCIYLFIDALDEFEGNLADMAMFLKSLGETSTSGHLRFKICAASRPISTFQVIFKTTPQIRMQDWTENDIYQVIVSKLKVTDSRHESKLASEMLARSEGVFLWVRLVLDKLTDAIFAGESLETLTSLIGDFPRGLEALYQQNIALVPPTKFATTRTMLELALCGCGRLVPLTLAEFSLAVLLPDQDAPLQRSLRCSPTEDFERCYEMEKRIKAYCGGLLEVVPNLFWESPENSAPQNLYAPLTAEQYKFTMSKVQFVHRTASEFVLSEHNKTIPGWHDATEAVVSGNIRMMRLYIDLAADLHGSYFLYSENGNFFLHFGYTQDYFIFMTLLFDHFSAHARDIEHSQSARRSPNFPVHGRRVSVSESHNGDEVSNAGKTSKYNENMGKWIILKSDLLERFRSVLCDCADEDWVSSWHAIPRFGFTSFHPSPETFLDFAILQGLLSYAKDAIETSKVSVTKANLDTYFCWAIMSIKFRHDQQLGSGHELAAEEILCYQEFTTYLLTRGASANSRFSASTIKHFTNETMDQLAEELLETGEIMDTCSVSVLQYALKLLVSDSSETHAPAYFNLIQQLVSAGADVNEVMLHRNWLNDYRPNDAQARTALHYILFQLPTDSDEAESSNGWVDKFNESVAVLMESFLKRRSGNALFINWPIEFMATVKLFLDHGADPNATDSEGVTVVEYAFKNGFSDVVELLLERGGLITIRMIDDDGKPSGDADGVLRERMWMTEDCYTAEAWERVRDLVEDGVALKRKMGKEKEKELAIKYRGVYDLKDRLPNIKGFGNWSLEGYSRERT